MDRKTLFWTVVGGVGAIGGLFAIKRYVVRRKWRLKAQAKRVARDSYEPKLDEVSEELKQFILSLGACELAAAIKAGKCSCRQAVTVYIERAYKIGRRLNLSAEENFEEALQVADKLDRKLVETPEKCGRFFGVPISIKDQINQKGKTSSCGLTYRLDLVAPEDANLLRVLILEDAIPIVRGNVCQAVMWVESHNHIYGRAMNPWDHSRIVGGSSGGDAALVACRSVPLAIGTDIGGSVRTPAFFCGVSALKPTPERSSLKGISNPHPIVSLFLIKSTAGPIARKVCDLKAVMETWCSPELWKGDIFVWHVPFNHVLYNSTYNSRKLRIGYFTDNGLMTPVTAIIRAVNETVDNLRGLGHDLVEVQIPEYAYANNLYFRLMTTIGPSFYKDALQGEEPVWFNQIFTLAATLPNLTVFLLKAIGLQKESDAVKIDTFISVEALTLLWRELIAYKRKMADFWEANQLDVIIGPPFSYPAALHGGSQTFVNPLSYAGIWNTVAFPAGVVPVTNVKESETNYSCDSYILSHHFNKQMQNAAGLPIGVQVAGLPNQDEKVLAVMQLIEEMAKFEYL